MESEKNERKDTIVSEEGFTDTDLDPIKKIEIAIRPNKQAMDALIANLKKSHITYQLMSLVHLFLDKKDRFDILITALQPGALFCTQNENLPFLSQERASDYLIKKYWSDIFEKEVIPLSPIPGHFVSINRCGITQVLLGPPNYHLYNDLIKEHYNQNLARDYSWEFFIQQIKNEHDPLLVKEWQKRMSEHVVFRLKANPALCFDSHCSAQAYLQSHPYLIKDSIKPYNAFSLLYADVEKIKDESLKKQIYQKIKDEFRSPISLGCFCRTRFRHAGFHLYRKRKGSSHVTLLCAIKRRVRNENDDCLSAELTHLVDYIEQHPMIDMRTCITDYCSDASHSVPCKPLNVKENLIVLIKAGYVTQFEDGKLYVSPKQSIPSPKLKIPEVANE